MSTVLIVGVGDMSERLAAGLAAGGGFGGRCSPAARDGRRRGGHGKLLRMRPRFERPDRTPTGPLVRIVGQQAQVST